MKWNKWKHRYQEQFLICKKTTKWFWERGKYPTSETIAGSPVNLVSRKLKANQAHQSQVRVTQRHHTAEKSVTWE